jgi:ABC-type Fe3+/spermidine/putrescine transport system ATPase subunit
MTFVEIRQVTKSFGRQTVLDRCSLTVEKGEIVSLLGSSGSGKTTLLNAIAGFVEPDGGQILIDGEDVNLLPPNRRQVGMVFQSYALFPHLRVTANIAYGLQARRCPHVEIEQQVARMMETVGLDGMGDRYPSQLSGGQQQRVALARVLVLAPRLLLLDEPFSALDAKLRRSMQVELVKLIRRLELTAIFVTHDQDEALTISDRVAVMRAGVIDQVDAPVTLYDKPRTAYVADFVGASNLIPAKAVAGRVELIDGQHCASPVAGDVAVLVRPENITLRPLEGRRDGVAGVVSFARHLGPTSEYEVAVDGLAPLRVLVIRPSRGATFALGTQVRIGISDPEACKVFSR